LQPAKEGWRLDQMPAIAITAVSMTRM